jgi:pre-mRNA cleavage complex 2 protein Pcf11
VAFDILIQGKEKRRWMLTWTKERAKRGLSRSWFVTESEWVNGVDIETTNQHAPIFADEHAQNGGTGGSSQSKKKIDEADADAHMVVVPSDSQGKPCPICGEQFITIWNDSEEEWMYKNAINVNGTVRVTYIRQI